MSTAPTLSRFWEETPPTHSVFSLGRLAGLPEPARRYLEHAIAPGRPLVSAVRLRMHGEIKLKGWCPFRAEQVIDRARGMIWNANVRMGGLPVTGFDRLVQGAGEMRWKMLGLFPVLQAAGADVTRSAAGRLLAELVWLPSAFAHGDVRWESSGASRLTARLAVQGQEGAIDFGIDEGGGLRSLSLLRWGNPGGGAFQELPFGGVAEAERTFHGFTIPTRLTVGWHFGGERFEREGAFVKMTVDDAAYR